MKSFVQDVILRKGKDFLIKAAGFTVDCLTCDFSALPRLIQVYEPGGVKPTSTCALFSLGENCCPLSKNGIVGGSGVNLYCYIS